MPRRGEVQYRESAKPEMETTVEIRPVSFVIRSAACHHRGHPPDGDVRTLRRVFAEDARDTAHGYTLRSCQPAAPGE